MAIQSQMYNVTRGDINRTQTISSLFDTVYQLNQYKCHYADHNMRLCSEKLKRNRYCTAQTVTWRLKQETAAGLKPGVKPVANLQVIIPSCSQLETPVYLRDLEEGLSLFTGLAAAENRRWEALGVSG